MFGQFVMKGELQEKIIKAIAKQYRKMGFLAESNEKKELPLFLSGGVDSTLCGLVAHSLGLKPVCISFQRKGIPSKDFTQAEKTCSEMGWKFHPIVLPEEAPKDAFFRMIKEYRVDKKTELEVLYPFTFLFDEVRKLHACGDWADHFSLRIRYSVPWCLNSVFIIRVRFWEFSVHLFLPSYEFVLELFGFCRILFRQIFFLGWVLL